MNVVGGEPAECPKNVAGYFCESTKRNPWIVGHTGFLHSLAKLVVDGPLAGRAMAENSPANTHHEWLMYSEASRMGRDMATGRNGRPADLATAL